MREQKIQGKESDHPSVLPMDSRECKVHATHAYPIFISICMHVSLATPLFIKLKSFQLLHRSSFHTYRKHIFHHVKRIFQLTKISYPRMIRPKETKGASPKEFWFHEKEHIKDKCTAHKGHHTIRNRVKNTPVMMTAACQFNKGLHRNKIKQDLVLLRQDNALLFVKASHQKTD